MSTKTLLAAVALVATLVAGAALVPPVFAQLSAGAPPAEKAAGLSVVQVHERLEAAGYRSIDKIERYRDRFEVKAADRDGRRVEIDVDPLSGQVMKTEVKRNRSDEQGRAPAGERRNPPQRG